MRCFFALMCVLALGVMGCSGTTGVMLCEGVTCEDDGNECTGDGVCNPADGECDYAPVEGETFCGSGDDPQGACFQGVCLETDCEVAEDLTLCWYLQGPSLSVEFGFCEAGECVPPVVECTGEEDRTPCGTAGEGYVCFEDACLPTDCEGLEDGTECFNGSTIPGRGTCDEGGCAEF